jgi:hypothetical protein
MPKADFIEAEDAELLEYDTTPMHQPTTSDLMTEQLAEALNDVSGSATVSLYRQRGSGKEGLNFLDSFPSDKYKPDEIYLLLRDKYGTGDYRVQLRENGKLRSNRLVSVEAPNIVSRETNDGLSGVAEQMMAQIQRQNEMIAQLFQQKPQEDTEQKFLEKMLVYKQLFDNGGHSKPQGIQEIIQTVSGLKELGINVGGIQTDGEKEDGFGDMLEKATPVLTALLSQNGQPQPQSRPNPQYRPNPAPKRPDPMSLKLKFGIATLVKAARKNSPREMYADLILDHVSEEQVKDFLMSSDSFEKLISVDKNVKEHKEWFEDLSEHLKAMFGLESKYAADYQDLQTDSDGGIKAETQPEIIDNDPDIQSTSD